MEPQSDVDLGRLFRLRLKRNMAAREDALGSIRPVRYLLRWNGERLPIRFSVRLGGRMRGRTVEFCSRQAAEDAVHRHYNGVMMAWLCKEGR